MGPRDAWHTEPESLDVLADDLRRSESMISISPYGSDANDAPNPSSLRDVSSLILAEPTTWLDDAQELVFFSNARSALWACLRDLRLNEHDEVCIQTTSNGPYISSCVTKTVESVCSWSRKITDTTKLVIVIHEFGFPCDEPRMRALRCLGIPLLEDCAYAVGSRIDGAGVGRYGDYAIYSLPKYYPVQSGGLLVRKRISSDVSVNDDSSPTGRRLSDAESVEILEKISYDADQKRRWNSVRRDNWHFVAQRLAGFGVVPYFEVDKCVVPGAFVCALPSSLNGMLLKQMFVDAGIEATEYYGHGGFYFPIHQFLREWEIDLMIKLFGDVQ